MRVFLIISGLILVSACTPEYKVPDYSFNYPNPTEYTTDSWSPDSVSYKCADPNQCPDNQGMLLAKTSRPDTTFSFFGAMNVTIYRCTGSLFTATKVISAGHCATAMADADEIYFRTIDKPGRPSRSIRINKSTIVNGYKETFSPDFAIFELESAVDDVQFAHPSLKSADELTQLTALVSNKDPNASTDQLTGTTFSKQRMSFVLNAVTCQNKINFFNPYPNSNPTVFNVVNCVLVGGNSGGAVVDPNDLTSVQGILSYSNSAKTEDAPDAQMLELSPSLRPRSADHPITHVGGASNARCVSFPGWPQVEAHCRDMNITTMLNDQKNYFIKYAPNWLEKIAGEWLQKREDLYDNGLDQIRLAPETALVKIKSALDKQNTNKEFIAFLPVPLCFVEPPNHNLTTMENNASVYDIEPKADGGFDYYPYTNPKMNYSLVLERVTQIQYRATYQINLVRDPYETVSVVPDNNSRLALMLNGSGVLIEKCTGGEVDAQLDVFKKSTGAFERLVMMKKAGEKEH